MITGKNNAPALYINGQKWKQQNEQRISVADRLLVAIGNKKGLTANDRLLLIVLIGQTDDPTRPFHPSEKWIRDRTGMSHDTYIERRKSLAAKGIIDFKEYESITVNLEFLENQSDFPTYYQVGKSFYILGRKFRGNKSEIPTYYQVGKSYLSKVRKSYL